MIYFFYIALCREPVESDSLKASLLFVFGNSKLPHIEYHQKAKKE
jgi:hypothetical protein